MTSEKIQPFMLVIGGFFLIVGIIVRLGFWKDWYWKGLKLVYGYIPMGLLFIFVYFKPQISQIIKSEIFNYYLPIAILLIMSALFSSRTPGFIKPKWVNWIESHPKRVVDRMVADVKSGVDWVSKVKDKKSIDAWARQIISKLPKKRN
jgi:hypothetical protein